VVGVRARAPGSIRAAACALTLLATCACTDRSPARFEQIQREATNDLRRGELIAAQSLAERGIALADSQTGSSWAWTFRLLRAESLILQLKQVEAAQDLADSLPAPKEFDWLRARQKYLLARVQIDQGRLPQALETVAEGRRASSLRDVRLDLDVLDGQIRLRLGRRAEAESLLDAVVAEASSIGDHYHQAGALNDLGMGRLVSNRFDEALAWFEQVLSLNGLESFTIYAVSLYNAGICYTQLGQYERAAALQSRAVEIYERRGPANRFEQALGELGRTYLQQGDPVRALPSLQRAFDVASAAHANVDAALWAGALAETHIELGHWDDATRFNDEATRMRRANGTGRLMWNTLNAANITAGRGRLPEARRLYEEAISASADEPTVRWEANAGLARVEIASLQPDRAAGYFERALGIIEQTRSDLLKTDYKLSYLNSLIQFYGEYVEALIAQGHPDRALEVADSSRARILAERQRAASPSRVNAATVRRVAERSGDVMLFYWLQPKASWLWVVTSKDIHLVRLPPGDRIEALVRAHQKMIASALSDALASPATPGDELYAALVAPAASWIPEGASVIIVPDGALHGLNFETLPVDGPARRHYWIEDVEVQIAPALGVLDVAPPAGRRDAPRGSGVAGRSLLLVGAPAASDPRFPPLSYAAAEMTRVAEHFDPRHVAKYEGSRATPAAYRTANPDAFSMIHFTAHAAANVESPLDSAVILAADGGGYKLYARDIADVPLHADLVTVSACRSAGERTYSGEGLIGFAWAFLRAGAKRVVAGLWDVDDQSTAGLMDGLYARIAAGRSPSRALREAKLAMLQAGGPLAKPYYWGPFEMFTVTP
jgi:CHAT domain-containing protein/Tfp pilus assembly protein PilF